MNSVEWAMAVIPRSVGAQVYVEAYGCSANMADSEMISGLIKKADYKLVKSEREADLNIIVTCTVKSATSQRMAYRIKELTRLSKPMIVAGCMSKTERRRIECINPSASLLGPNAVEKVVEAVGAALMGERTVCLEDSEMPKVMLPRVRCNPVVGIVEMASGCLSSCSFCQVKVAKRGFVSYPPDVVAQEAASAVRDGCREIWLTSQDSACYGWDIHTSLPTMLKRLCSVDGVFFIRVGMMNPSQMKGFVGDLTEAYHHEKVFKFLHTPVQSGSNRVLKLMNRGYVVEDFVEIVRRFRDAFPDLNLSTDIIVGFPTESEDDFANTVRLIEKIRPDTVNISKFGPRPGTEAALMPQLKSRVVKSRSSTLHEIVNELSFVNNRRWVGWQGEALVEEQVRDAVIARNSYYKPILLKPNLPLGSKVEVEVVNATVHCLMGKILPR